MGDLEKFTLSKSDTWGILYMIHEYIKNLGFRRKKWVPEDQFLQGNSMNRSKFI